MVNPVTWLYEKIIKLNDKIWNTPFSEISRGKTFLFKQLRIIIVAARGFEKDKIQLRASALTFYSLLSIIPVAAIGFAIAKGFSLDQNLKQLIIDKFKSEPMILNWLLENATGAIEKTRGGYMAGVGVIILFWAVMLLINNIESSFNHIWQVRSSRVWYRQFTDYLTIMIIAPIFLILSAGITGFIITTLPDYMSNAPILDFFKPVVTFLVKFIPYILTWISLTILFIIMPNAKVKFAPAVIAAVIAGTILQIIQWLYIDLQFGITKLNAIYGSFAAVPLFIIWLQSSWTIVLLGAEISFANQNVARYDMESEALNISNHQKRVILIMIMQMIIRNFSLGEKPVSAEDISLNLKIPARLALEILQDLTSANLLSVTHENEEKENLFQPAMDINKLTVSYVIAKLDNMGFDRIMVARNQNYEKVISMLAEFDKLIEQSDENILIKDL